MFIRIGLYEWCIKRSVRVWLCFYFFCIASCPSIISWAVPKQDVVVVQQWVRLRNWSCWKITLGKKQRHYSFRLDYFQYGSQRNCRRICSSTALERAGLSNRVGRNSNYRSQFTQPSFLGSSALFSLWKYSQSTYKFWMHFLLDTVIQTSLIWSKAISLFTFIDFKSQEMSPGTPV